MVSLSVDLVVTVDCWTKDLDVISHAKNLWIDVIITDHHAVPDIISEDAIAVINPKRDDCNYMYKHLAWAWVAFKLVQALVYHFMDKDEAERLINKRIDFLEEITFNNEVICDFSKKPAVFCKKIENIRDTYERVNKSELFNEKIDNGMKERYKNSKFIKEKYPEFEVSEEIK